ncbi:hypothetical protein EUX98_g591 [Antrodiella citrinella]|uniref:Metal homeostatis protein bsd2 n=1 Tax=Antrodiella citrinella TaxID=2447956 RepID=A0A4V3XJM4_9APHY|nr:hypothetical protein EUX98_g591 [Antrodiella citrinella]
MSSARYAPLPNQHTDPNRELEAAFDDSEDEDDEPSPLNTNPRSHNGAYQSLPNDEPSQPDSPDRQTPRAYDFENIDYDYIRPPPGSPPSPTARAFSNDWGNSNGLVPSFVTVNTDAERSRRGWFRRTAQAVLPSHYVERLGWAPQVPTHAVGGGTNNDGDETLLVPEETSKDAPPSYASAQADAAPSYWETTIHAPSASNSPGEMIIDGLQTGSLFSFLWNMLVSISFQFVGFLLTYLLHTTHAAKLGSRAGLGVTLIQYGFAMRSKTDEWDGGANGGGNGTTTWASENSWWKMTQPLKPQFETAAEAEQYYKQLNETMGIDVLALQNQDQVDQSPFMLGDVASEWLSFFLMTIGWFLLLTSLLSFWRVKRWERSILSSATPAPAPTEASSTPSSTIFRAFGFRNNLLSQGLGFPPSSATHTLFDQQEEEDHDGRMEFTSGGGLRGEYVLPDPSNSNPETTERLARAFADEARLQRDLRAAGLL